MKGKLILPPSGYKARPTTDFAREGLFNVLNNEYEFEDLKVLDLFGGTGAIAFEFASRGAARVYSVEMARENATFIKREADRLGLANVTMVRANVFDFLPLCREKFDLVFADPPYDMEGIEKIPQLAFYRSGRIGALPIRPMPWKDWKPCPTKSCHAISCIPAAILSWSTATSTISPPIPSLSRKRFTGGCIFRFLSRNN